jgi:hypothetical protein|tara:strand:- start:1355 stop:1618 length:264 start_codon:yes stop_codon:yes gene_type:complete
MVDAAGLSIEKKNDFGSFLKEIIRNDFGIIDLAAGFKLETGAGRKLLFQHQPRPVRGEPILPFWMPPPAADPRPASASPNFWRKTCS